MEWEICRRNRGGGRINKIENINNINDNLRVINI